MNEDARKTKLLSKAVVMDEDGTFTHFINVTEAEVWAKNQSEKNINRPYIVFNASIIFTSSVEVTHKRVEIK